MSAVTQPLLAEAAQPDLQAILGIQRNAFHSEGEVTHAVRVDRLKRLKSFIVENKKAFASTTKREYGDERSYEFSLFRVRLEGRGHRLFDQAPEGMDEARPAKGEQAHEFSGRKQPGSLFRRGLLASSRPGISRSD